MGQYHDILGVPADADKAAIKKAYRTLAKKYHQDNPEFAGNWPEDAKKKFLEVGEAYEGLNAGRSGPTGSSGMDAHEYAKNHFGMDPMDFIREMAKNGRVFDQMSERMANTKVNTIQKMRIPVRKLLAGGKTIIEYNTPNLDRGMLHFEHFTKEFDIPKGALVGSQVIYPGEGGRNEKGEKGDLIIQLFAADDGPYEIQNEIDIIANIQLNPFDIILGTKKKVRHPDGVRIVAVDIPPGGHPQNVYAEEGSGLAAANGQVGDMLLQAHLVIPQFNKKQRATLTEALEKIQTQASEDNGPEEEEFEVET